MALVDPGEVLDAVIAELAEQLRHGETVGACIFQHSCRAVEPLIDDVGPTVTAERNGRGPVGTPEATHFMAYRLATGGAQITGLPAWWLNGGALLA